MNNGTRINWLYCNTCGWQTKEPNIAAVNSCCGQGLRVIGFDSYAELQKYLPAIRKIGIKKLIAKLGPWEGIGVTSMRLVE